MPQTYAVLDATGTLVLDTIFATAAFVAAHAPTAIAVPPGVWCEAGATYNSTTQAFTPPVGG